MLDDEKRLKDELSNFGQLEDVPCDDNCGYHSFHFGSQAIGKTNLIKSPEIPCFRKIPCYHTKNTFDELKSNEVYVFFLMILIKEAKNWIERFCQEFMIQN